LSVCRVELITIPVFALCRNDATENVLLKVFLVPAVIQLETISLQIWREVGPLLEDARKTVFRIQDPGFLQDEVVDSWKKFRFMYVVAKIFVQPSALQRLLLCLTSLDAVLQSVESNELWRGLSVEFCHLYITTFDSGVPRW